LHQLAFGGSLRIQLTRFSPGGVVAVPDATCGGTPAQVRRSFFAG
jgi:hypothetical protein